jgi:hypothetical protein
MDCEFLSAARIELEEGFHYYQAQRRGLGHEFAREVYRTLSRVQRHPNAWTMLSAKTRRCRTSVFFTVSFIRSGKGEFWSSP